MKIRTINSVECYKNFFKNQSVTAKVIAEIINYPSMGRDQIVLEVSYYYEKEVENQDGDIVFIPTELHKDTFIFTKEEVQGLWTLLNGNISTNDDFLVKLNNYYLQALLVQNININAFGTNQWEII